MFAGRSGIGRGIAATAIAIAIVAPAGVAGSEALNGGHGPDHRATAHVHATAPPWLTALMARSEALDRAYGLGEGAAGGGSASAPAWLTALMARSDALDRQYRLGKYAVAR